MGKVNKLQDIFVIDISPNILTMEAVYNTLVSCNKHSRLVNSAPNLIGGGIYQDKTVESGNITDGGMRRTSLKHSSRDI